MSKIEMLAYSPLDMAKFVDYFVNGILDENGKPKKDEDDREITGVMAWLHGRLVTEAHFFSSPAESTTPVKLFVSSIQSIEPKVVPWMKRVPWFHHMVRDDGLIGLVPDFASATEPGMATPLDWVVPRHDLDAIFVEGKAKLAEIDFSKLSFSQEDLLAALQGDSDLRALLSETESKLGISYM
jgi:hypothetical protein